MKKGKRILIVLILLSIIYLGTYIGLSMFGQYRSFQLGERRYDSGVSITDNVHWQPKGVRFNKYRNIEGRRTFVGNFLGYFYSPLIMLDRKFCHKIQSYFEPEDASSEKLQVTVKDDAVKISKVATPPVIDGKGDDVCWQNIYWRNIDNVWMPYGAIVDSKDYSGRYKVAWSSKENLLYFLVEIVDDVIVDGYVQGETADVYNFDILEVFIDEDKSGGLHVFDGTGDTGSDWGTNAENAFSYHIYVKFPKEGEVTKEFIVLDIAGEGWDSRKDPNYASHFPQFALTKKGNLYTREFSLKVYNDTYEESNPEASRVQIKEDKIIGLSLAYCDNDDPNEEPKTRDSFFGSIWVPEEANNDHWKNADYFGTIKLISNSSTDINKKQFKSMVK